MLGGGAGAEVALVFGENSSGEVFSGAACPAGTALPAAAGAVVTPPTLSSAELPRASAGDASTSSNAERALDAKAGRSKSAW